MLQIIIYCYYYYILFIHEILSGKTKFTIIQKKYALMFIHTRVGLLIQGVVFELNSAPQMYFELFFELFQRRELPYGTRDFVPSIFVIGLFLSLFEMII